MGHTTVLKAGLESPLGHLPADVQIIQDAAQRARDVLNDGGPLPRYEDMTEIAAELSGMLRVLIDDVARRCPAEYRKTTGPAIAEGLHWLGMCLGDGLQSAADCTRALADITLKLCALHRRTLGNAS